MLKHISKSSSAVTPSFAPLTSTGYTPFPPPPPVSVADYLGQGAAAAFLPSPLGLGGGMGLPGYMLPPPSSTASHLLPGLMGLPPPPATPLSPFGASLESLARAAEERARSFGGNFSPGTIPPVTGFSHSPGATNLTSSRPGGGGGGGGGVTPSGGGASVNGVSGHTGQPVTSESGDPPLLRHEHMHTHLHYITSPTHASQ